MAQIYLVRHTCVDIPQGICYGASDVPLTNSFNEEAKTIKSKLQGISFDRIYSSPLQRCIKLADILAPKKYTIDNRLSELHFGEWELQTWESIYNTVYGKKWMENYLELPCPKGESYIDLFNRITEFINNLNKNDKILIITHSGVIRVCLYILKNIDISKTFRIDIKYGEIIKI